MEIVVELLKITLPAVIVSYALYLIVRTFVGKELEKMKIETALKNNETIMPIRLQAYERMCLFLERIAPGNVIQRLNASGLSAKELHTLILRDIREEFNHNLSQQLYMSEMAWKNIKMAMETNISMINEVANTLPPEATNMELVREILDKSYQSEKDNIELALSFVKSEIQSLF